MEIEKVIKILRKEVKRYKKPSVTRISLEGKPFKVLISCLLSLRTKDKVTIETSLRLFKKVNKPEGILKLKVTDIEKLIYPVGFYKTKAKRIKEICEKLIKEYNSKVPDEIDELLKFKGVGRKTANLVVGLSYGKPSITVDVHVHRISNRLGYVKSRNPYETEFALREKLPKKYWIVYNNLLVTFGQNICKPIKPLCFKCKVEQYCGYESKNL